MAFERNNEADFGEVISSDQYGIEIQTYCAIIACLLLALWPGKKPTLRTYEMICCYFTGLAGEDELKHHIKKLKTQPASVSFASFTYAASR